MYESNKIVIIKMNVLVGKGYLVDGLFKLNMFGFGCDVDAICSFVNAINGCDLWHYKLSLWG